MSFGDVPRINDKALRQLVDAKRDALLIFHSDTCPHCKTDQFRSKAIQLAQQATVPAASFNVNKYGHNMPSTFDIQYVPTIVSVAGGKVVQTHQ